MRTMPRTRADFCYGDGTRTSGWKQPVRTVAVARSFSSYHTSYNLDTCPHLPTYVPTYVPPLVILSIHA